MAILHRIPVMQGDAPVTDTRRSMPLFSTAGNLTNCQWCGKELQYKDTVWECVGNLDHYLVCDECHQQAIIH